MKKYIYTACMAILFGSCTNDFLDRGTMSEMDYADYFVTQSDFESALVGCYDALQSGGMYGFQLPFITDIMTTDAQPGGTDKDWNTIYDPSKALAGNKYNKSIWTAHYTAISRTNFLIDAVDTKGASEPGFDAARMREIRGEALFVRSLAYLNLVRLYVGGVPLILTPVKDASTESLSHPRYSEALVYRQIVKDLETAAVLLPVYYGNGGYVNPATRARATKGAAYALLAQTYASFSNANVEKQAAIAASMGLDREQVYDLMIYYCDLVIDTEVGGRKLYSLLGAYDDLFNGAENTSESILEIQFSSGLEGSSMAGNVLPAPYSASTWKKLYRPTTALIESFDGDRDMRYASTVVMGADPTSSEPAAHRYKSRNEGAGQSSPNNFSVIRLSEILLLKAEAVNEKAYGSSEAFDALNQVVTRAGLDAYTQTSLANQGAFRTAVRNHTRFETALEGRRWFHVIRWNMSQQWRRQRLPIPSAEGKYNPEINEIIE